MYTLCSIPNHTYAVMNLNDERLISIKGGEDFSELVGYLGKKIDDLFIKKHLRKCKLIGEPILGERLDNGTWTGNLGLIQEGEAIVYLKSEALLIDTSIETWMNYLFPFHRESFVILHDISSDISKASRKENISNVLNCFNFDLTFLSTFLCTFLLSFLIIISLKLLSDQNNRRMQIGERVKNIFINYLNGQWNLNYSKLTNLTIFILFYSLHLWFIQLIIANNIKTDKVIVDQSILIKDENEALMTKRTFCLFEGETEFSIALNSNSNILAKLYQQKNIAPRRLKGLNIEKGERCIVKKSIEAIDIDPKELFTIISENSGMLLSSIIGNARPDLLIWFYSKPIFEANYHLISRNQKDLIDLFNRITLLNTESGIFKQFFESISLNSYSYFQSHTVYRSIEEFVNGNTKFTDLKTESFRLLFIIYISFCLTILIINLLDYLLAKNFTFILSILLYLKFKFRSFNLFSFKSIFINCQK